MLDVETGLVALATCDHGVAGLDGATDHLHVVAILTRRLLERVIGLAAKGRDYRGGRQIMLDVLGILVRESESAPFPLT